jgi:hypothetical protein
MFKKTNTYYRCQFDVALGIKRTCRKVLELDSSTPVPNYPMCPMHGKRYKRLLVEQLKTEKDRKMRDHLEREEMALSRNLDAGNNPTRLTHPKNARVAKFR